MIDSAWEALRWFGAIVWLLGDLILAWQYVEEPDSPLATYDLIPRIILAVGCGLLWPFLAVAAVLSVVWERVRPWQRR